MLTTAITSITVFFKENYMKIIVASVIIAVFYLIFFLSTLSLRKLKTGIFQSYPFGLFFPEGGTWSIGYFLLIILLLGLLIFLGFKERLFLGPA